MAPRTRSKAAEKTPIERIFEKVVRREMTSQERVYFHLSRRIKSPPRGSANKSKSSRAA
jgi:hypothetical protein